MFKPTTRTTPVQNGDWILTLPDGRLYYYSHWNTFDSAGPAKGIAWSVISHEAFAGMRGRFEIRSYSGQTYAFDMTTGKQVAHYQQEKGNGKGS